MPPNYTWKKLTYSQIPASLQRMGTYKSELKNQTIYMFHTSDKTYWLPAIELARRLHFCSSEIVRTAICEGAIHSFGRAIKTGWEGQIDFLPHIPVAYLNNPEYRKYFAWLMFDQVAKDSFSSIFTNRNSKYYQDHERWTFDFSPPELEGTEVAWADFTDRERKNCFIREIRSIIGIKAPSVDTVWFNHPDDKISFPSEDQPTASNNEKKAQIPDDITVDIEKTPRVTNRHRLVRFNKAGLHFDLDICTKRCPRYMMQAPTENKNDTEEKQGNEVIAVKQGDETGDVPRADFMVREDQDFLESIDKFDLFQKLLTQLQIMNPLWVITHSTGQVPRGTCRKLHKIGNRFREYLFATVQIDEDTKINILEIELEHFPLIQVHSPQL